MSARALTLPLAVSSLGLPDTTLEEVVEVAVAGGCQGLELRTYPGEPIHLELDARERATALALVRDHGLVVSALASYVEVAAPGPDQGVHDALRSHIDLAYDLNAPGVRVFAGGDDDVSASDARARTRLASVAEYAAAAGVRILLETHDSHPRGVDVARILPDTGAGVIWDVAHSSLAGEDLETSMNLLAPWLVEVQIKDLVSLADLTPAMPGTGVVALQQLAELLHAAPFSGWLCLEWERAWHPHLPPASDALAAVNAWLAASGIVSGMPAGE